MKKRLWSILLVVAMCLTMLPAPVPALAEETQGTCGEGVTWYYDDSTATLTISGSGAMVLPEDGDWLPFQDDIRAIVVAEGITSICERAFGSCPMVETVQIASTVTTIGAAAFADLPNLTTVAFDAGSQLESIETDAFNGCVSLTDLTIPASVTMVGTAAFADCANLQTVTFAGSVGTIASLAFADCGELQVIVQGDTPPVMDSNSFANTTVTIHSPENWETAANGNEKDNSTGAKTGSEPQEAWTYDADTKTLTIHSDEAMRDYNKAWKLPPWYYDHREDLTTVILDAAVTRIGNYAFYDCQAITSIKIQGNIGYIGESAFQYCDKLKSIAGIEQVTSIGKRAFYCCARLESFTIPDGVTEIAAETFVYCAELKSITIPSTVEKIGNRAFQGCAWPKIIFEGNAPEIADDCFSEFSYGGTHKVTADVYYPKDKNWTEENRQNYGGQLTWFANPRTVTFDGNADGAANIPKAQTLGPGENTATEPAPPTRTGYEFGGWYTDATCAAGQEYDFEQLVQEDLKLYAKWEQKSHRITFHYNDGSTTDAVQDVTEGEKATVPELSTRTGYEFGGWYTDAACTAGQEYDFERPVKGDLELYAKWTVNTYQVMLHTNGGTIAKDETVTSYTYGQVTGLPTDVSREGYTFGGWYENSDYSGNEVTAIGETETGDKEYHAKWTVNIYLVTLNTNGGTIAEAENVTSYTYGAGATLPQTVSREGYTFGGWYESSACDGSPVTAISVTDIGDKTYYAKWTPNTYTATFLYNENGAAYQTMTVPYNGFTPPVDPTKEGYTFLGWYSRTDTGEYEYNFAWAVEADLTLYAKWGPYYFDADTGTLTISEDMEGLRNRDQQPWAAYREQITRVVIKEGVKKIGGQLFGGCSSLTEVTIPNSVTEIGYSAFADCTSLKTIGLPKNLTIIGTAAFGGCTALTSMELPESVTEIQERAFSECDSLTSIEIPEKVTEIQDGTFEYCYNLTSVTIPSSVTAIRESAFSRCDSLKTIDIPNSVTMIGSCAFMESGLECIVLPDSVEVIGADAFEECESLTDVTLPKNLTKIPESMFAKCSSLKTIVIPDGVRGIGWYAFGKSGLESITIPASVKDIASSAFASCRSLQAVVFEGGAPDFDDDDCFKNVTATVYYPKDAQTVPWTEQNMLQYGGQLTWRVNALTIIFHTGNGSTPAPQTTAYGGSAAKPDADPEKTGYLFGGWYRDEACTAAFDFETTKITDDTSIYAKWIALAYTVHFDSQGGNAVDDQTVGYGSTVSKPADPTRTGYDFKGWYMDAACKDAYDFDTLVTGDLTLYAKWVRRSASSSSSGTASTYSPAITKPDNGDVTISPASPKQGDTVIITPKMDDGYGVGTVTVTDSKGKAITVRDNGDGTYSFIQPRGKVTIAVTYQEIGCLKDSACPLSKFADVSINAWYHDGVHYVLEEGLMGGRSDNQFAPNATITRAELAQILYNKAGRPEVTDWSAFSDVPETAWYASAVAWAQQNKVVNGIGNNKFAPNQAITREQIAVMLYNDAGRPEVSGTITGFADVASVSDWAKPAVLWATQNKIIGGALRADGKLLLNPTDGATRAETANMLKRYYSK